MDANKTAHDKTHEINEVQAASAVAARDDISHRMNQSKSAAGLKGKDIHCCDGCCSNVPLLHHACPSSKRNKVDRYLADLI